MKGRSTEFGARYHVQTLFKSLNSCVTVGYYLVSVPLFSYLQSRDKSMFLNGLMYACVHGFVYSCMNMFVRMYVCIHVCVVQWVCLLI